MKTKKEIVAKVQELEENIEKKKGTRMTNGNKRNS